MTAWERIGKLPASRAKTAVLRLAKVDDPALARLYVRWLGEGRWPAPTAKVVWERIFAHLVALQEGGVVAELRGIAKALPPFVGEAHRAWVRARIEATAAALAKAPVRVAAATPVAAARAPDRCALVWADPDDDAVRDVVADALIEAGDPRGELVALQRAARSTPAQRARVKALLAAHAVEWLGAIGALTKPGSWEFAGGFATAVAVDRRAVPRRAWEAALTAPEWATIRTLHVSILETPKWWITAWAKTNRRATAFEVGALGATGKSALRLERDARGWRVAAANPRMRSACDPILRAFAAGANVARGA